MAATKSAAVKATTKKTAAKKTAAKKPAPKKTAAKAGATPAKKTADKSAAKKPANNVSGGRPRKVSDEELYAVLLEEPSPSRAAQLLGVHRNTIVARLKDPALRDLLIEHRRRAAEIAGVYLADRVAVAAKTLVELVEASGPQDSVRLGAAMALLRTVRDLTKHELEAEKPDDVWEAPPKFELRLVEGGAGKDDE